VKRIQIPSLSLRPAVQRKAATADLTTALYVCSQFTLRIVSNLMIAFWIHLFEQVPPGIWDLSVNYKLKLNETGCTLAFSGKFSVICTS